MVDYEFGDLYVPADTEYEYHFENTTVRFRVKPSLVKVRGKTPKSLSLLEGDIFFGISLGKAVGNQALKMLRRGVYRNVLLAMEKAKGGGRSFWTLDEPVSLAS